MLTTQASLQSIGLLGRTVEINSGTGAIVGTVTALSLATDTPQLTLTPTNGAPITGISLSQITSVR
jgi:flagellar basal-body rod modification protein FlgD